jgi:hypothetical protein
MTHHSDSTTVLDWLDSAAIPEQVRSAIVRCLDELEERRPITEAVQKALRGADPFDEIPEPINGLCPLCQRDVPGMLLSGKFLPMRGAAHAATCPNAAGFFRRREYAPGIHTIMRARGFRFNQGESSRVQRYELREHADKLLAEADAMARDPNFSWAEHGEKLDRTLAEYRAASDAWLAAALEERGEAMKPIGQLWPSDHPIPLLRGRERLPPSKQRKALWIRQEWLQKRICERLDAGEPVDYFVDELAAIEQCLENIQPATCCAGCGSPGVEHEHVPAGQAALHWVLRGKRVCVSCYRANTKGG